MPELAEEALKVIQSYPEGVLQSELWKLLDIDSRKCSRVVKKLVDDERVERIEYRKDGIKTYVIKAKRPAVDPSLLLAGGELLPCICCEEECEVQVCPYLLDWIYQLAIEEFEE
ncbi:AsnC family transcriptional regulator [Methanomicrobiaceae archaeon CYW5]|uniref:helix-turn-helix transcriptional regulator n=1 Tax=Methanovulcanius yangii TaxID=1789227 RepID=UPI0029CA3D52|nr:Lrp/AsnC family transcriptional regulator [Methanovulcanius yangii]MBT8507800.1 AsnC family transcriptional regulator [Methanovulcanius yangii]